MFLGLYRPLTQVQFSSSSIISLDFPDFDLLSCSLAQPTIRHSLKIKQRVTRKWLRQRMFCCLQPIWYAAYMYLSNKFRWRTTVLVFAKALPYKQHLYINTCISLYAYYFSHSFRAFLKRLFKPATQWPLQDGGRGDSCPRPRARGAQNQ